MDRLPRHGQQYDFRRGRLGTRYSRGAAAQFGNDPRQFGRATLIAEQNFVTLLEGGLCDASSNVSRSEHSNLQSMTLQHTGLSLEAVVNCDAVGGGPARKTNHSVLRLDDVVHIESVKDVLTPGERAPAAIVGLKAELQIQQRVTRHEVQRRAADRGRCQALVRGLRPYEARPLIGQRVLVVDTRS